MAKSKTIELGGNKYNAAALRSVTEQQAVVALRHKYDPSQIRNAWKQANGLTVRNYAKAEEKPSKSESKSEETPKPKRKRSSKPKTDD